MRTIKLILLVLTAALLLSACAAPSAPDNPAAANDEAAALRDQVESLTGKVEQLQEKVSDLEQENQLLQSDSTVGAAEDLSYLLDQISESGQTVVSYTALVSAVSGSGDEFTLTIQRQDTADAAPEQISADRFTYVYYGGYLLPELDESFGDYIAGVDGGALFSVYMLGDKAIYLVEMADS